MKTYHSIFSKMSKSFRILLFFLLIFSFHSLIAYTQSVQAGDIIYANDGVTPRGIVFWTDANGTSGWMVALKDANSGNPCKWGTSSAIPYLSFYGTINQALGDTAGYHHTKLILDALGTNGSYAAQQVGYATGWYLPAAGQLRKLYAVMPEVNAALTALGGDIATPMAATYYWSSTPSDASNVWLISFSSGYTTSMSQVNNYMARAVSTFQLSTSSYSAVVSDSQAKVNNSIIHGNKNNNNQSANLLNNNSTISYTAVEGSVPAGTGNKTVTSADFVSTTDFHLKSTSQLNFAGNATLLPADFRKDIVGKPRRYGKLTDMGAYQHVGVVPASITLSTNKYSVLTYNSFSLTAVVKPENTSDKSVTWISRYPDIAEVVPTEEDGRITVLGKADGVTYIVATASNGIRDSCRVQVGTPIIDLLMDRPAIAMIKGTSEKLAVHIYPDNATYNGLNWKSRNPAVATVNEDGKVTAANISSGQTYIVVSTIDGSLKDSCLVTVTDHVSHISMQASLAISLNESYQLTATVTPSLPEGAILTWRSSSPEIISVDENGTVTALANGKALIVVLYDGQTASCEVSVKQRISGTVKGSDQSLLNGIVYAYRTWVINGKKRNVIAPIEISLANGQFEVDLAPGRYYFQAISANLNYIPGYYGNINSESGLSPIKWDDPNIIVEELPSTTTSLDIVLGKVSGDNVSGQGVILGGNVEENKPDEYTKSTMARPVAYATVILYGKSKSKSGNAMNTDDDGYQKLMQVQSDEYGNFSFGELSKNYHYKVHIEVTGYSFEQLLSINDDGEQCTTYTVMAEANFDQEEVIAIVDCSTSARIEDQIEAKLYPNPATDMVRITIDTDIPYTIRIFNLLGQQVMVTNGNSRETILDVNHLKAGVYFVRIEAGGKIGMYKLIKN